MPKRTRQALGPFGLSALKSAQNNLVRTIRTEIKPSKSRSVPAAASPRVEAGNQLFQLVTGKALVRASGPGHKPPLKVRIYVPKGGFRPKAGIAAFPLKKPEGGLIFRSRTYTKYGGRVIELGGFVEEALRKNIVGFNLLSSRNLLRRVGHAALDDILEPILDAVRRSPNIESKVIKRL